MPLLRDFWKLKWKTLRPGAGHHLKDGLLRCMAAAGCALGLSYLPCGPSLRLSLGFLTVWWLGSGDRCLERKLLEASITFYDLALEVIEYLFHHSHRPIQIQGEGTETPATPGRKCVKIAFKGKHMA